MNPPILQVKIENHGLFAVHNMPCPVCSAWNNNARKAVLRMETGVFHPCWNCQEKEWRLYQKGRGVPRPFYWICWLMLLRGIVWIGGGSNEAWGLVFGGFLLGIVATIVLAEWRGKTPPVPVPAPPEVGSPPPKHP